MAEYIERGAFIELVKDIPMWGSVAAMFADRIPAADVAPVVHGRWIVRFGGPYNRRRCYCSHCGKHPPRLPFQHTGRNESGKTRIAFIE